MNSEFAHTLMKRADAARRRLAELDAEASDGGRRSGVSLRATLKELDQILSELHIATEQLEAAAHDLTLARQQAVSYEERYREFHEALPVSCLLTTDEGCIEEANSRAAHLLNVGRRYLPGKPLMLFLPERDRFFHLMETVRECGAADGMLTLRPRELKPRLVKIDINVLPQQTRWCWLISETSA